jgi:DNA invertase Pin-like site-specific DNA recombinase
MEAAVAYLRVSSEGQIEGDGFNRQKVAIRNHAEGKYKIKTIFEECVSGTTAPVDRPVFRELLQTVEEGTVKVILVENLGRLARDLMIQENILGEFKKRGVRLVSVQEPDLGEEDPGRKLIRQIIGSFHEYERSLIVLKLKASRERSKARNGFCEGRKPYGHYPNEKAVLNRIITRAKETNPNRISEELNQDNIPTRSGGKWYPATVNNIIRRVGR